MKDEKSGPVRPTWPHIGPHLSVDAYATYSYFENFGLWPEYDVDSLWLVAENENER